jgi:hypothetical protein
VPLEQVVPVDEPVQPESAVAEALAHWSYPFRTKLHYKLGELSRLSVPPVTTTLVLIVQLALPLLVEHAVAVA